MPRKLMFSKMFHDEILHSNVVEYGQQNGLDIQLHEFDWASGWSDFMRMAIYGGTPDISEMGSTWVTDFAAMNVLRPFSQSELQALGNAEAFVPSLWESGSAEGMVWSIPWMTDVSLVIYRRDLLAKAGVGEQAAFHTPECFEQTLQKLQDAGVQVPWIMPTRRSYYNIHGLAMWVWHSGEELVDRKKRIVLFDKPKVRSAIISYLRLSKFIPRKLQHLGPDDCDQVFQSGKAAVTISGSWNISNYQKISEISTYFPLPLGRGYGLRTG